MIPEDKLAAVTRALEAAFGGRPYDSVEPLAANDGLSQALAFRMELEGRPYLLRFVKETMPGVDPTREFAFVKRAAEVGIAPHVWYTNVDDRLMISDFVDTRPYPPDAATRLAHTLQRLHALTGFTPTTNAMENLDRFVQALAATDLVPRDTMDELMGLYRQAAAVYPRDPADWVPSHNDLKPQNILFDGDRLWLVDWEAAFMNDRYHDLAVVANFFANTEPQADAFLTAYFGAPADAYQRARFYVMSQLLHVTYVAVFSLIAARAGVSGPLDGPAPDFRDFQRRIVAGEVNLGGPEAMHLYAHIHLNRALEQMRAPRFAEAIAQITPADTPSHHLR